MIIGSFLEYQLMKVFDFKKHWRASSTLHWIICSQRSFIKLWKPVNNRKRKKVLLRAEKLMEPHVLCIWDISWKFPCPSQPETKTFQGWVWCAQAGSDTGAYSQVSELWWWSKSNLMRGTGSASASHFHVKSGNKAIRTVHLNFVSSGMVSHAQSGDLRYSFPQQAAQIWW